MKALFTLLVLITVVMVSSCQESDLSPGQRLEFQLVVFNELGERTNSLNAGEDFSIGLDLINHTKDTLYFSWSDYRRLFTQFYGREDFLLVYEMESETMNPIGKPYDPENSLNFVDSNLSPTKIPPQGKREMIFGFFWSFRQENQPMDKGRYFSSFTDLAAIEGFEVSIDTSIEFEMN
ncbi:hypothetical protein PBT90_18630 [Algoriphagus halophytocola]|uniref:Gliding motility lipoprotein GldH n=1 Tax=Algoriphagus halophytocola TaxID=2991499 RepID=A0ABY6MH53_9BACT|nr:MULTISPECIES: hypothetical protein [unclassified Algoriphagus]UZD21534.1 hypothetical protein OM944_12760 [Algoriphagus sp. TR-M5]WBL42746.1 hypothetical protein PBT90_18630 [Algoriphagus sp. TR-M9]